VGCCNQQRKETASYKDRTAKAAEASLPTRTLSALTSNVAYSSFSAFANYFIAAQPAELNVAIDGTAQEAESATKYDRPSPCNPFCD